MRVLAKIAILIMIINQLASAEIILSEILANEPSNRVLLEWFEIYNSSDTTVFLENYMFIENGDTLEIPDDARVAANSYAVLCRRLEPVDGGDCFEYYWGDSSGTWGDSPEENYQIYEVRMTLSNSIGSIYILRSDSIGVDHYIWDESTDDRRSIERDFVLDPFSNWHECYDPDGSTPGRENSTRPSDDAKYYLSVEPQAISLTRHEKIITLIYGAPSGTEVTLYIYDDSALRRRVIIEESPKAVDEIIWDLRDDNGSVLPSGLYFLSFRTAGAISVQKNIPIVIAP